MKISKRTREQAALICAIAASQGEWHWCMFELPIGSIDDRVIRLAEQAFQAADARDRPWFEVYAEAEALLRTGWTP